MFAAGLKDLRRAKGIMMTIGKTSKSYVRPARRTGL